MIKKGDIFYKSWFNIEFRDGEKSSIEIEEWHVRYIDRSYIYLREKNSITYGKLSKKHHDYGWLKYCDPFYKMKLELINEDYKSKGLHKSKSAAYRACLPEVKKALKEVTKIHNKLLKNIEKVKK